MAGKVHLKNYVDFKLQVKIVGKLKTKNNNYETTRIR